MHSTSFHLSRITYVFLGIIAGVFIGTTIRFVLAWNIPTDTPPDGNVDAPLNVSDTGQTKVGPIGINTNTPDYAYGLNVGGNAIVGGKIYSTSTTDSDPSNTVVTKDYLEGVGGGGFGFGQTWQDVTTVRVKNREYKNNTGKPIMTIIFLSCAKDVGGCVDYIKVDGLVVSQGYSQKGEVHAELSAVVPPGSTYGFYWSGTRSGASAASWSELTSDVSLMNEVL